MALAADSRNYKGSGAGEVAGIYRLHTHLWPSLMIIPPPYSYLQNIPAEISFLEIRISVVIIIICLRW